MELARIVASQGGVFTRRQAVGTGYSAWQVRKRLRDGQWLIVRRGVLAVAASVLGSAGRVWAAYLAAGAGAVVSHLSAAHLHGLLPPTRRALDHDPTASTSAPAGRAPGAYRPFARRRDPPRVSCRDGQGAHDRRLSRDAALQAGARPAGSRSSRVGSRGMRLPRGHGRATAVAGRRSCAAFCGSRTRVRGSKPSACSTRCCGAPASGGGRPTSPSTTPTVGCSASSIVLFRLGLVIEVDGRAWHSADDRFQRDRRRQNALIVAGYEVLRFTWEDLAESPEYVIATIREKTASMAA